MPLEPQPEWFSNGNRRLPCQAGLDQCPLYSGFLFWRKAEIPSLRSSVPYRRPIAIDSISRPTSDGTSDPLFMRDFAIPTDTGASLAARSSAILSTSAVIVSAGKVFHTNPIFSMYSPLNLSPESIICIAREIPMSFASLWEPPQPGTSPSVTSGSPNCASGVEILRSHQDDSSNPPPRAYPDI